MSISTQYLISEIELQNFLSYKHEGVSLNEGVTLLTGLNKDDSGQLSNGSGKSGLIEAVYFAITGSSLRGVSVKQLIRRDETEMSVMVRFRGLNNLSIIRTVSQKKAATCEIWVNTEQIFQPALTQYNEWIMQHLGLDKSILQSSHIISRQGSEPFCQCTETKKREFILKLAKAGDVDKPLTLAGEKVKTLDKQVKEYESKLAAVILKFEHFQTQVKSNQGSLSRAEYLLSNLDENTKTSQQSKNDIESIFIPPLESQIFYYKNEVTELNELISELKSHYEQIYNSKIEERRKVLADKKAELQILKTQASNLMKQVKPVNEKSQLEIKLSDTKEELSMVEELIELTKNVKRENSERMSQLNAKIQLLRTKQSNVVECPHCGKVHSFGEPVSPDEIKCQLHEVEKQRKLSSEVLNSVEGELIEAHNLYEELKVVKEGLEKSIQRVKEIQEAKVKQINSEWEANVRDITVLEKTINELQSDFEKFLINSKKELSNPDILDAELILKNTTEIIGKLEAEKKQHTDALKVINNSIDSFLSERRTEIRIYSDQLRKNKKELENVTQEKNSTQSELNKLQRSLSTAMQQHKTLISFKSWLCQRTLQLFSELITNRLLKSGSGLGIRLDGFKELADGRLKEEITITTLRNGLDIGPYGSLSAGERARIDLATLLATHDLFINQKNTLNLLIIDEILDSVDAPGISGLIETLQKTNFQVILVSQHEIALPGINLLTAIKQNNATTLR